MKLLNAESRKERYLPTLSSMARSKTYLIFDVETDLLKVSEIKDAHKPKLVCARILTLFSDGSHKLERECIFWKIKDFHFWVYEQINKYYTLHILAHNTGYDVTTIKLFDLVDHLDLKCTVFNPHRGNYFMQFQGQYCKLVVIDSMNWFNTALKLVGESIGFKKLVMPKTKILNHKWLKYCLQDVNIVVQAMLKLSEYLSQFDLGDLRITNASISFTIFRKHFHSTNLLTTTNLKVLELEYASYYGGRTEMFRHGQLKKANYYYYDFNSLYPSVMIDKIYSTKLRRFFAKSDLKQLKRFITSYGCIAKVRINTDKPFFPKKLNGFTAFPVGRFITTLATPELIIAIKHNLIETVFSLAIYQQKEIFTEFTKFFHSQKQKHKAENNTVWTQFDKLILNSLYGKFGQKIDSLNKLKDNMDESYLAFDFVDIKEGIIHKHKIINHTLYEQKKNLVSTYSIPSIASEVTSYARVKMLDVFNTVGWENIHYCDTDSVIVNEVGMKIIKEKYEGHKLGDLELEDQSNNVNLRALKDYTFGKTTRLKSVPTKAKKLSKNSFEYTHFNTTIEGMKQKGQYGMMTTKRIKTLTRKYSKGLVMDDGTIKPLSLDE